MEVKGDQKGVERRVGDNHRARKLRHQLEQR